MLRLGLASLGIVVLLYQSLVGGVILAIGVGDLWIGRHAGSLFLTGLAGDWYVLAHNGAVCEFPVFALTPR
jgi:hypothetical protein